ncbi:hypothetical protein [Sphingobacterium thermophilum]|uniref:Uncharacterized protein n=1 Tax=Sphingobacterium thermophilum TaxID=768534 RepID=A0ABP8R9J0_9SPHI
MTNKTEKRLYEKPDIAYYLVHLEDNIASTSSTIGFGNPNTNYQPETEDWNEETNNHDYEF